MDLRWPSARWLFFLLLSAAGWSSAQSSRAASATRTVPSKSRVQASARESSRMLTQDEGLTILGAALERRGPGYRVEAHSDCSHLVHAIYERAGFEYDYASSSDLYAGAEGFERVTQPQPGDLVVWRGHAGIVVSPRQHTFFSALRSGFGVENYDSAYWMGRGRPRFFRYAKQAPASAGSGAGRSTSLKTAEMRPH